MVGIVLLIVSAVIGAGFSTGAELVAFFGATGLSPWVIAVLVGACIFSIMAVIVFFERGQFPRARHFFTLVNFSTFVVMAAGIRHIAGTLALILSLAFCIVIVFFGFSRVVMVNKYLMFFVLAILLSASLPHFSFDTTPREQTPRVPRAIYMAILYAGLNCCILQKLLSRFANKHSKKQILVACAVATIILVLLVGFILTAIFNSGTTADMPILDISNNFITRFAVFLCILTSMVILLDNLVSNEKSFVKNKFNISIAISLVALGFSFFGFKDILGVVYPIVGGLMILYCFCLLVSGLLRKDRFVVHDAVDGLQIISDK